MPVDASESRNSGRLNDYALRWAVIGVVAIISCAGLRAMDVALDVESLGPQASALGTFLMILPLYVLFGKAAPRFKHLTAIPVDLTLSIAQICVLVLAFLPISYKAMALGRHFPAIDETLALLDAQLFGFHWETFARWVAERPLLERILSTAYFSLLAQAVALLVIGSLLRPGERNSEFIWIAIVSMALTSAVSIFTPALGKIGHVGTDYLDALHEIRSGDWRSFSYNDVEGIVTFPSFHTTLAVIFSYVALRLHAVAAVAFCALNAVMLISIPPIGGHYIVDLFGGAAIAGVSIVAVYWLHERGRERVAAQLIPAFPRPSSSAQASF